MTISSPLHPTSSPPFNHSYEVENVTSPNLQHVPASLTKPSAEGFLVTFGDGLSLAVSHQPFRVDISRGDTLLLSVNNRGLLNFEHYRERLDEEEEGTWAEAFLTHQDSKPKGPSSVGIDISFAGIEHVYGIPEHADDFSLRTTR